MQALALPASHRVGFRAALASAGLAITYVVAQLLEWAGLLGSSGGPNSPSTPAGLVLLLLPSLLLGSAFVIALAALHETTVPQRRVFSLSALAFAVIYATLTGLVYFVQLTFVAPRLARGEAQGIELLLFRPYESFLFAVDLLGYALMSLATLLAALAVEREGKALRRALLANGALLPFLALQMTLPWLIYPAAAWALTFPAACLLLARRFRRLPVAPVTP